MTVQLKNDTWDEVLSAVADRDGDSISESLYRLQLDKSEALKYMRHAFSQETVQCGEPYASTTGRSMLDFEVLDSMIARGLRKVITCNFEKQVATEEGRALKKGRCLTRRQITWMRYKNNTNSGQSEAILDFGELMKVELKMTKCSPLIKAGMKLYLQ